MCLTCACLLTLPAGHPATISTLSYAIRFWSKGTKRAMFLRHEGFLGSIGAWIKNVASDHALPGASSEGTGAPAADASEGESGTVLERASSEAAPAR